MRTIRFYMQIVLVLLATLTLSLTEPSARSHRRVLRARFATGAKSRPDGIGPVYSGSLAPNTRIFPFDGVSQKRLLEKSRERRMLRGELEPGVDTVRVVLIRVSFDTDRENGLSTISTGGDFDLTPDGGSIIDPTPHGKSFFESHMEALRTYFHMQSCNTLEIEYEVFPEGESSSYKISDLADYGPGYRGVWTIAKLVSFFRDCVESADGEVNFADYDAIVVAHAGANLQGDIDYDSPNDPPSFFARLGPDDQFLVDGGSTMITEGSVVPEYASQDGYVGGIGSVLAHEFGHQLGLPDLYNSLTNYNTIGAWCLMDGGGSQEVEFWDSEGNYVYASGVIPGNLCAWSRYFLGWLEVDTVMTFDNSISLSAVEKCPARAVRVPAGEDEYFLIENRAAELDGMLTSPTVDENGVFSGFVNCTNCPIDVDTIPDDPQLEGPVNGYDYILPTEPAGDYITHQSGPGLLIWHIDDRLISQRWEDNTVNAVYPFGVSLVEADGAADLGNPNSYFGFGWWDDAYFDGNNSVLSDSTLPPSWSSWAVPTGIRVENISGRDTLMSFGAGARELVSVEYAGEPSALEEGVLVLPGDYRALVIGSTGEAHSAGTSTPVFTIGSSVVTPAAVARDFDSFSDAVIVGESCGRLHAFVDGVWTEFGGWPVELPGGLVTHPATGCTGSESFVAAADSSGRVHILDSSGGDWPGFPVALQGSDIVVGNIVVASDSSGRAKCIYFVAGGDDPEPHSMLYRCGILSWDARITADPTLSAQVDSVSVPLTGLEIKGDVYLVGGDVDPFEPGEEIFVVSAMTGRVFLFGRDGLLSARERENRIVGEPAIHDLNGDSYLDLIYSDGAAVYAVSASGANVKGWPRILKNMYRLDEEVKVTTPVTTMDTHSGTLVAVGTDSGLLYLFDAFGELVPGYPRKIGSSFDSSIDIVKNEGTGLFVYSDGHHTACYGDALPKKFEVIPRVTFLKWRSIPYVPDGGGDSWASVFGGTSRSAFAIRSRATGMASDEWLDLAQDMIVYPNPSNGERVGVHFTAPSSGVAELFVMTLDGELVLEDRMRLSGGEDEFLLSLTGKAPGIYLCRLVLTSNGRSVEAFRKFAIVR